MFGQHDRTTQHSPPPTAQGDLPDSLPPVFDVPRFLADLAAPVDRTASSPRYEGTWRVALGRPGGF